MGSYFQKMVKYVPLFDIGTNILLFGCDRSKLMTEVSPNMFQEIYSHEVTLRQGYFGRQSVV